MERAASSKSLKVLGCLGAVWAITARVSSSTLSSAPQQGQATSKLEGFFIESESYRKISSTRVAAGDWTIEA
jgi:hypothetical protein